MSTTVKVVSLPKRSSTADSDVSVAAPASGTGWKAVAAIPFADGQGPAVAVVLDNATANTDTANEMVNPTANATVTRRYVFPSAVQLTKLSLWAITPPVSAGGTVLFTAKKNAGNTCLNAANFDAKTLVAATTSALTLTATAADLLFAAGDYLELKIVSNNADMTGAAELRAALEFVKI